MLTQTIECTVTVIPRNSDDNHFRYYKGGLSAAKPTRTLVLDTWAWPVLRLCHPTLA
jgi:hypothetical protein